MQHIDDRIVASHPCRVLTVAVGVPTPDLDAQVRERLGAPLPRYHGHPVPVAQEIPHNRMADVAGRPEDERVPRACLKGEIFEQGCSLAIVGSVAPVLDFRDHRHQERARPVTLTVQRDSPRNAHGSAQLKHVRALTLCNFDGAPKIGLRLCGCPIAHRGHLPAQHHGLLSVNDFTEAIIFAN